MFCTGPCEVFGPVCHSRPNRAKRPERGLVLGFVHASSFADRSGSCGHKFSAVLPSAPAEPNFSRRASWRTRRAQPPGNQAAAPNHGRTNRDSPTSGPADGDTLTAITATNNSVYAGAHTAFTILPVAVGQSIIQHGNTDAAEWFLIHMITSLSRPPPLSGRHILAKAPDQRHPPRQDNHSPKLLRGGC
jgi:hypothetical protein